MRNVLVSGRMAIVFDKVQLRVRDDAEDEATAYRCSWCGWTYVVDDPHLIPDHSCSGPPEREELRVRVT
jgi:hypothetical protein